jgi:hypothetical protein
MPGTVLVLKVLEYSALTAAIVFAVALIGMMVLYSSQPTQEPTYQQSAEKHDAGQHAGERDKSFWQRVTKDPVAFFTMWLVIFTAVLSGVAVVQLKLLGRAETVAEKSANAAKESADVARQALIATQRAWVRPKASVTGPLIFDQNGASTSIGFEITNIGSSPALAVTPHAWLMALTSAGPYPFQEMQRKCNAIREVGFGLGYTLFPGENFPSDKGFGAWSLGINISREDIERALPASADGKYVSLYVIGCIDYTFPTDPNVHHQTGFIYGLTKRGSTPISPDDGQIPAANLMLIDNSEMGASRHAD